MSTVTLIPGDGIGPEVSAATRRAVDALETDITWDVHDAGVIAIETHGTPLPLSLINISHPTILLSISFARLRW
jgi:isocitrate dehydrogenase (NAD+)